MDSCNVSTARSTGTLHASFDVLPAMNTRSSLTVAAIFGGVLRLALFADIYDH